MSQREVLEYMEAHPNEWVTYDDLVKELNIHPETLKKNIWWLIKSRRIIRKYVPKEGPGYSLMAIMKLNRE